MLLTFAFLLLPEETEYVTVTTIERWSEKFMPGFKIANSDVSSVLDDHAKSNEIRTLPRGSDRAKTLPHGSDRFKALPRESDRVRTLPRGSDRVKTLPRESDRVRTLLRGSGVREVLVFTK